MADGAGGGTRDVEARELLANLRSRMFSRRNAAPRLGRYRDLERIGQGGMGIVYAARDPELDRRVALKVVRLAPGTAGSDMLREARVLARAEHPNIVPVLDVGTDGDETFIAMALVEGTTFDGWLEAGSEGTRPWPEIVGMLLAAGRGVAAAHERGVVHLDLKPSNLLVGNDGRLRVTDFGLAHELEQARAVTIDGPHSGSDAGTSTRVGGGTLGYAAPEQLDPGAKVDARADQFALGVCLYEALSGRRPWEASTVEAFVLAVASPPAALRTVPRRVAAVVERALRSDPNERFADMNALVEALDRATRGGAGTVVVVGALGLVVALASMVYAASSDVGVSRCPGEREVPRLWTSARGRVESAFANTRLPYAADSFTAVDVGVRRVIDEWVEAYRGVCEPGPQRGSAAFDARLACLEGQRSGLQAYVEVLEHAEPSTVQRAVESVMRLPRASKCADPALSSVVMGSEQRAAAEALTRQTGRARALFAAGAYDDAAEALGDEPDAALPEDVLGRPLAEDALLRGQIAWHRAQLEPAAAQLERAHALATVLGDERLIALSAARLVVVVGVELGRYEDGARWRGYAEAALVRWGEHEPDATEVHASIAALARATGALEDAERWLVRARIILDGRDDPVAMSNVLTTLGNVYNMAGRYDESQDALEQALALAEQHHGREHPRLIEPLVDLGALHKNKGSLDAAEAAYTRALTIAGATLPEGDPKVAVIENNLGSLALDRGDDPVARRHFERALQVLQSALGPDNPRCIPILVNLASLYGRLGEYDAAVRSFESALDIIRVTKGEDDPMVGYLLINIAQTQRAQGDREAAQRSHEKALDILERALGPDHPDVAVALLNLAGNDSVWENYELAERRARRALTIRRDKLGPDHPKTAHAEMALAIALGGLGRLSEARALVEHAIEIRTTTGTTPGDLVEADIILADLWWREGERAQARASAESAAKRCESKEPALLAVCEGVGVWLTEHPAGPPWIQLDPP